MTCPACDNNAVEIVMPNADINAPQSSNPGLAPFLDDAPTPAYIRSLIAQGIQISEVDHDKAVVLLRKACSLAELCRDEDGLIDALIALAWCFQSHGQPAQALSLASRALVHAEHNNNMQGWRNARYIIATAQTNAGNHLEAERILRELIDHAQSLGLRTHEADYRVELGLLYRNISRFGESLELCKTAYRTLA
jgi:tetratricopeptide (TPR) repeat protein